MRLLLLSTYFAPETTGNAPYATRLAEHFSESHKVTVVAGWPHYPAWSVSKEWRRWRSIEVTRPNLRVVRLAHYVPRTQSSIHRAAYEASWAVRAGCELLRHEYDCVLAFSPTMLSGPIAVRAARRRGVPCGLIVQDLVGRAALHSGIQGGARVAAATARVEAWGFRRADRIATIHPQLAAAIVNDYGVDATRVQSIYNWSHVAAPIESPSEIRRRMGWRPEEVVCLHSGNMGHKQALETVVAAARFAEARHLPIRFVLAGDGNQREWLMQQSAEISSIEFRDPFPTDLFTSVLAAADVLLLSERGGASEMSVPSKLTSYLAAGRPVVAACEANGATARLVLDSGAGKVCIPEDAAALVECVLSISPREGERMGELGRQFRVRELSEQRAFDHYDAWLEQLN